MGKYSNLFDSTNSKGKYSNLFPEEEETNYSSFRSGSIDFLEAAIGAGDELDATIQLLTGDAANWSEAIDRSRAEVRAYEEDNPNAAMLTTALGFGAALFIPGAGLAKIAQAGTKLDRAVKAGVLTGAEGAAYGFLSGEGEEGRTEGAALGAALGGTIGSVASRYLTKGTDEIEEAVKKAEEQSSKSAGSHMGGESGFVDAPKRKEQPRVGSTQDSNLQERSAKDVTTGTAVFDTPEGSGTVGNIFRSTKDWITKNVGERAARLAEDAETMIRHDQRSIDEVFETTFGNTQKIFDEKVGVKALALRMNSSIANNRQVSWENFSASVRTPEEKTMVENLKQQVQTLQGLDFMKLDKGVDYFPTILKKGARKNKDGSFPADAYENPMDSLKQFAQDISGARALAARFKIDLNAIKIPSVSPKEMPSRMNLVIKAIEKEAYKQGASKEVAANLGNGLRSQLISSKQGGNAAGAIARRVTSAALLANPMNAVLNLVEGVTAPIFQNGVSAWAKTVPGAVLSTVSQKLGQNNPKWLSNNELGLNSSFMGEVANTGRQAMVNAAEGVNFAVKGEKIMGGIDFVNKAVYKLSGVETVNRMGQEILTNSAIQRGISLAKKGNDKSLDKLRKHDGMRGLTETEFQSTVKALQNGDFTNPFIVNFAGASLNKWQPVSASTMPKAFHDNPNGRMAYSMLSYMNRQMNNIVNDIGLNLDKAQKKGLNSKEGAQAAKDAMLNSAKYVGIFGVVAGVWDDFRKTLDLSKDKNLEELMTPEGIASSTMNQLASNMSSGLVNMRAEEFGGSVIELLPAPLSAGAAVSSGLLQTGGRLLTGEDEAMFPALRAARTYAPGAANIDRVLRMTTGERLFSDLLD